MKVILLIEDNNDIRENTCELLELKGYAVIFAIDGKSGLASAKQNQPDVILCDILMPQADGYEVITKLKNDTATAHIPFIFLTASAEKKDEKIGYAMGASGYIRKPFQPDELFNAIARCLDEK